MDQLPLQLRDLVGPIDKVDVPGQGYTSDVFILSGANGRYVVKRAWKPPFHEWLRRESNVLQSLRGTSDLIPKPLCYVEDHVEGKNVHWLLMEHLPGIPLRECLRGGVKSTRRRELLFAFGCALAQIHQAIVPEEMVAEGPWLDRMLALAASYLRDYEVDGDDQLLARLTAQRPAEVAPCLIHGDYTMDNVLVSEGRVSGLIDWCWGAFGDPRYDLALATRPKPEAFGEPADLDAFYEGYGGRRLTEEERDYFVGLYEFF